MMLRTLRKTHRIDHLIWSSSRPFHVAQEIPQLLYDHYHDYHHYHYHHHRPNHHVDLAYDSFDHASSNPNSNQPPLLILHGLFGSKQNWRSIAKMLSQRLQTRVFTLDLRNHGSSPSQVGECLYLDYANDVQRFIDQQGFGKVNLLGHSMGGKVAMTLSLLDYHKQSSSPIQNIQSIISKLVIVDIAPVVYPINKSFQNYTMGMKSIHSSQVSTRSQADQILSQYAPDKSIRQFLLTNLIRNQSGTFQIRLPLKVLDGQINSNQIGDFPLDLIKSDTGNFNQPSLFVKGNQSDYINSNNLPIIQNAFRNSELVELEGGHWVHAEKPLQFVESVSNYLEK